MKHKLLRLVVGSLLALFVAEACSPAATSVAPTTVPVTSFDILSQLRRAAAVTAASPTTVPATAAPTIAPTTAPTSTATGATGQGRDALTDGEVQSFDESGLDGACCVSPPERKAVVN